MIRRFKMYLQTYLQNMTDEQVYVAILLVLALVWLGAFNICMSSQLGLIVSLAIASLATAMVMSLIVTIALLKAADDDYDIPLED